jgi:hypothetical protein
MAEATGIGSASAEADATGGGGGGGVSGARAGNGSAVTLDNAATGTTHQGALALTQNAQGGYGGFSDTGVAGSGGAGTSILSVNDLSNPVATQSLSITAHLTAHGGTGGNGGSSGGAGGAASATGTIISAGSVDVESNAAGGNGGVNTNSGAVGAGGGANAAASGQGTSLFVLAQASGGLGDAKGVAATASATGTGTSGSATALASTSLLNGLVYQTSVSATATVAGAASAVAAANIGGAYQAEPVSAGIFSNVDALPGTADVNKVLHANSNLAAGFAGTADFLAIEQLQGANSAASSGAQISVVTTDLQIDLSKVAFGGELKLGFYGQQVKDAGAISDVHVSVTSGASTLLDEDFSSVTAAEKFFTNDIVSLTNLGMSGLTDLDITLVVTSNAAGASFGGSVLAGDVSTGGRAQVVGGEAGSPLLGFHHVIGAWQM